MASLRTFKVEPLEAFAHVGLQVSRCREAERAGGASVCPFVKWCFNVHFCLCVTTGSVSILPLSLLQTNHLVQMYFPLERKLIDGSGKDIGKEKNKLN